MKRILSTVVLIFLLTGNAAADIVLRKPPQEWQAQPRYNTPYYSQPYYEYNGAQLGDYQYGPMQPIQPMQPTLDAWSRQPFDDYSSPTYYNQQNTQHRVGGRPPVVPIGDAILPLCIMMGLYIMIKRYRKD